MRNGIESRGVLNMMLGMVSVIGDIFRERSHVRRLRGIHDAIALFLFLLSISELLQIMYDSWTTTEPNAVSLFRWLLPHSPTFSYNLWFFFYYYYFLLKPTGSTGLLDLQYVMLRLLTGVREMEGKLREKNANVCWIFFPFFMTWCLFDGYISFFFLTGCLFDNLNLNIDKKRKALMRI